MRNAVQGNDLKESDPPTLHCAPVDSDREVKSVSIAMSMLETSLISSLQFVIFERLLFLKEASSCYISFCGPPSS